MLICTRTPGCRKLGDHGGDCDVAPRESGRRKNRGSNKNDVPSAKKRRELKAWMLSEFGDGITVTCRGTCGRELFWSEITCDRHPLPGRKGGRYVKGNIRPMCMSCNAAEGARQAALERAEEAAKREARNARRREQYRRSRAAPESVLL